MMLRTLTVLSFTVWFLTMTAASRDETRDALVRFMTQLSPGNKSMLSGWNTSSYPCHDQWTGVDCDAQTSTVISITLDGFNLTGSIDANSLCSVSSLLMVILSNNSLVGELPAEISKCTYLIQLNLHSNLLSGDLPLSLLQMRCIIKLDLSDNGFTGSLPDLPEFPLLVYFHAEQNQFSGEIPDLDRSLLLMDFNVSENNLSGRIPGDGSQFDASSFSGNPGLCGPPLLSSSSPPVNGISSAPATALPRRTINSATYFCNMLLLLVYILLFETAITLIIYHR